MVDMEDDEEGGGEDEVPQTDNKKEVCSYSFHFSITIVVCWAKAAQASWRLCVEILAWTWQLILRNDDIKTNHLK